MRKRSYYNTRRRKGTAIFKLIPVLLLFILAGSHAVKQHSLIVDPPGEYGTILDPGTAVSESASEHSEQSIGDESDFLSHIPEYSGTPVYVLNGNKPEFTDAEYEKAKTAYIQLSELDGLGRCGPCEASLGKEMLDSAGDRRDISSIHPSGWNQAAYPDIIEAEGGWIYHRSHLIAHMFAGAEPEIDGEKNLITGTEYCNESAMLPYAERAVQGWLLKKADGDRVLYRVTPVFSGNELICRGVHIEAADAGTKGTRFHINVFCYNVEPGIEIDYLTGRTSPGR